MGIEDAQRFAQLSDEEKRFTDALVMCNPDEIQQVTQLMRNPYGDMPGIDKLVCKWCGDDLTMDSKVSCQHCGAFNYCNATCMNRHWRQEHRKKCSAVTRN